MVALFLLVFAITSLISVGTNFIVKGIKELVGLFMFKE